MSGTQVDAVPAPSFHASLELAANDAEAPADAQLEKALLGLCNRASRSESTGTVGGGEEAGQLQLEQQITTPTGCRIELYREG